MTTQTKTKSTKNAPYEWEAEIKKMNGLKVVQPVVLSVKISPAGAKRLLQDNEGNRAIKQRFVDRYTDFMDAGEWLFNGESIKLSCTGKIIDGQHRLLAIIEHGKPVPMLMVIGIADSAFAITDTGNARKAYDVLGIAGYKNASNLSASLRLMLMYQKSETFTKLNDVSPQQILMAAERWPHLEYVVAKIKVAKMYIPGSVASTLCYLFSSIDEGKALNFFTSLNTGLHLNSTSAIYQLREALIKNFIAQTRLDHRILQASLIICWNSYYENTPLKSPIWDKDKSSFPIISGINREKVLQKYSGISSRKHKE